VAAVSGAGARAPGVGAAPLARVIFGDGALAVRGDHRVAATASAASLPALARTARLAADARVRRAVVAGANSRRTEAHHTTTRRGLASPLVLPGRLPLPRLEAAVAGAREARQGDARQDEDHGATPGQPRHEIAGSPSTEDLLARAAEGAAEAAAAPLLQEHDEDEEQADEDVDDREERAHGVDAPASGRGETLPHLAGQRLRRPGDGRKIGSIEGGAPDQRTIDVGALEEAGCVGPFDASAVQDQRFSRKIRVDFGQLRTDRRLNFLRLLWSGHFAGADRPHWFVGDDAGALGGEELGKSIDLASDDGERLSLLALLERFADAGDGAQALGQRGGDLLRDGAIGFAEKLSSLAVADDDPSGARFEQHGRADFAGEGTVVFGVHVLRGDGDAAPGQLVRDGGERGEGWRDENVDVGESSRTPCDIGGQRTGGSASVVHLPISSDERAPLAMHQDLRRAGLSPVSALLATIFGGAPRARSASSAGSLLPSNR